MLHPTLHALILAQYDLAQYNAQSAKRILLPLVGLLILSAILVSALAFVRRRMHAHDSTVTRDFSLGDLRALHREGKLTTDEFEKAKSKLVSNVRATLQKEKKPSMVEERFAEEVKDA